MLFGVGCSTPGGSSCAPGSMYDFRTAGCTSPTTARDERLLTMDRLLTDLEARSAGPTRFVIRFRGEHPINPAAVPSPAAVSLATEMSTPRGIHAVGIFLPDVADGLRAPVRFESSIAPEEIAERSRTTLTSELSADPDADVELVAALSGATDADVWVDHLEFEGTPERVHAAFRRNYDAVDLIEVADGG